MSDASNVSASVLSRIEGQVAILTLNRPECMNAVDHAMIADVRSALKNADLDPAVRAVVLVGAGHSFMAGADLRLFQENLEDAPHTAAGLIDGFHDMLRLIRAMRKPVIAGLNGAIAGGGLGLALACDVSVMADDATLISAYSKIGISPDAGTTWSLTHLLGRRGALLAMWLNEPINAASALEMGLVSKVVDASDLMRETLAIASRIADGPPEATARIKRLVEEATTSNFVDQLDREKAGFIEGAGTAEFREGITAFLEKRRPKF